MAYAAIDKGTRTCVLVAPDTTGQPQVLANHQNQLTTPSAIHFGKKIRFGADALSHGIVDPEPLVTDFKRELGTDKVLATHDGKEYRAKDCVALFLKFLAKIFEKKQGDVLTEVAVCRPANFTQTQTEELIWAAEKAGLRVVITPSEPTAALLGLGVDKRGDGTHKVAIADLGGGTFDVSIAEIFGDEIRVLATGGVPKLGGIDFSKALLDIVLARFEKEHGVRPTPADDPVGYQQLLPSIESAKHTLSEAEEATVLMASHGKTLTTTVTRAEFDAATKNLVDQAIACITETLSDAKVDAKDLLEIIPVGGGSQNAQFLTAIESTFGKPPSQHTDHQLAIAKGTFLAGRIEKEREGEAFVVGGRRLPPIPTSTRDVSARSVGIIVVDREDRHFASVIVPKGKPLPSTETGRYTLRYPKQESARIAVVQAEDGTPEAECELLGEFTIRGLPAVSDRPHPIHVEIRHDRNGLVHVKAMDQLSDKTESRTIRDKSAA